MPTPVIVAWLVTLVTVACHAEGRRRFLYYSHAAGPDAAHTALPRSEWYELLTVDECAGKSMRFHPTGLRGMQVGHLHQRRRSTVFAACGLRSLLAGLKPRGAHALVSDASLPTKASVRRVPTSGYLG